MHIQNVKPVISFPRNESPCSNILEGTKLGNAELSEHCVPTAHSITVTQREEARYQHHEKGRDPHIRVFVRKPVKLGL